MTGFSKFKALPLLAVLALLPACGMMRQAGNPPTVGTVPGTVTTSGQVQQAQLILQQQGTYNGQVDGVAGPSTQAALRLYQQAHSLPASGALDPATKASLNIDLAPAVETPHTQMADGSRMSQADARRLIESQGFTNVNGLYQDDNAVWRGIATRNGRTGEVAIDAKGDVVTS